MHPAIYSTYTAAYAAAILDSASSTIENEYSAANALAHCHTQKTNGYT
jgi:hypothetical protein